VRLLVAHRVAVIALLSLGWAFAPGQPEAVDILDGVDPVLLLQGKEIPGKEGLHAVHDGYRYLFASAETKAQFEKEPARYEPAFGGTCARMGARTTGSPQLFAVHDGRIYLFGSENCLRLFQATPARYIPGSIPPSSPSREAITRGAELLEQAARAIGGQARLEALTAWRLEMARPSAQTQILTVAVPDRVREERRASFGTVINVDAPADTFGLFIPPDGRRVDDQRPSPQKRALSEVVQRDAARALLSLLRNRHAPGVTAAALGAARVGDVLAEAVEIRSPLLAVTLAVDPKSGRIVRESYRDRGPDGTFGEIALDLSDYREVNGWTLPFVVTGSFEGQPAPALGYTVVSWTLNPPLEASSFARPAQD
jgi:YHS domain-containing protein